MTDRELPLESCGSVCTNVGGLDLGFERAGFKTLWQCEVDEWRRKMLRHRFPHVPRLFDDLTTLDPSELAPVDVLHGGTPCQDFSNAGARAGLAGAKSSLFHHFVRIRDAIEPIYTVWENVLGSFTTNAGRDFAAVLGAFVGSAVAVPADGWRSSGVAVGDRGWAVWRVLDAQWLGVPQRRRRVIVVASTRTEPRPEILLEPEGVQRHPSAVAEERADLASRIGASVDLIGVAGCLTASTGGVDDNDAQAGHVIAVPSVAATLTKGSSNSGVSAPGRRQEYDVNLVALNWRQDDAAPAERQAAPTLDTDESGSIAIFAENQRGELRESDVALSLTVGGGKPGQGYAALREGMRVRRLTPLEYERLQGFPDGWTIDPDKGSSTPDGPRYAACGDAVAVPMAHWVASRLKDIA